MQYGPAEPAGIAGVGIGIGKQAGAESAQTRERRRSRTFERGLVLAEQEIEATHVRPLCQRLGDRSPDALSTLVLAGSLRQIGRKRGRRMSFEAGFDKGDQVPFRSAFVVRRDQRRQGFGQKARVLLAYPLQGETCVPIAAGFEFDPAAEQRRADAVTFIAQSIFQQRQRELGITDVPGLLSQLTLVLGEIAIEPTLTTLSEQTRRSGSGDPIALTLLEPQLDLERRGAESVFAPDEWRQEAFRAVQQTCREKVPGQFELDPGPALLVQSRTCQQPLVQGDGSVALTTAPQQRSEREVGLERPILALKTGDQRIDFVIGIFVEQVVQATHRVVRTPPREQASQETQQATPGKKPEQQCEQKQNPQEGKACGGIAHALNRCRAIASP